MPESAAAVTTTTTTTTETMKPMNMGADTGKAAKKKKN
jgi:hypothetical protein